MDQKLKNLSLREYLHPLHAIITGLPVCACAYAFIALFSLHANIN